MKNITLTTKKTLIRIADEFEKCLIGEDEVMELNTQDIINFIYFVGKLRNNAITIGEKEMNVTWRIK